MIFDDFFTRALAAAIGIALIAGPLGCFIVWRRMSYFGDSIAHTALLGVALGLLFDINLFLGTMAACGAVALLLVALQQRQKLATDTLLGILSHSGLAIGLVVLSLMDNIRIDLLGYLFGDILSVSRLDLLIIWGGGALVLTLLLFIWRALLFSTLNEEMAAAEGIPVLKIRIFYMMIIAFTIAVAMKIVGILLITALLVIPAATARRFARSPEQMAVFAAIAGALAAVVGLIASLQYDTPSGPSIVVAALGLYAISLVRARA